MERALIVGWFSMRTRESEIRLLQDEMRALAESAGAEVVGEFVQKKEMPDRATLIGSGKIEEISLFIHSQAIETVIFFNSLTNVQQRNLEEAMDVKVIDRTRLILDIFATRARSMEGKLQVELAQLLYLLPRLTGKGIELSRLGGGIGTRGPGETKLEVDRRTIKKRISLIRQRLEKVIQRRSLQRKSRQSHPVPVVSLVSYTSAGKSTLFKALTGENVLISSQLFSTLDPVLRKVDLDEIERGYYFLLTDTVGFIRQMPEELTISFKATLEEMVQADIIVHLVDIANPDYLTQKKEVERVLAQLEIPEERVITLFNKIDLLPQSEALATRNSAAGIYVSAKYAIGIGALKRAVFDKYFRDFGRFVLELDETEFSLESIQHWAIVTDRRRVSGNERRWRLEVLCPREKMVQFRRRLGGMQP